MFSTPAQRSKANAIIGSILQANRERNNASQEQVAKALGVSQAVVSKVENGKRSVRVHELIHFSLVIGISPYALFDEIRTALLAEGLIDSSSLDDAFSDADSKVS